ncbi:hypothetical protein [Herbaspirillum sp. ST 5-3]|uniref:hypothetical protein n=1 Tax=Oxalobacteraceae TaxID=75682 RepID=UPI0010A59DA1|nr:hypothetical protein [Herbaspirillum sp. ST 5-3]
MFSQLTKALSDTYTWPVTVKVPANGGKQNNIQFDAEFHRVDQDEVENIFESARSVNEDGVKVLIYSKVVDRVLVNMKAKNDEGKYDELPDDLQASIRRISGADRAIANAFTASITGEKAKNS